MSCNGCRVLRKGCSEDCIIRPCLNWIKNPESQANATVFLAKFYGRTGLMNLIRAGPEHLRPAIFTSLLYEACGRLVNPVYGSAGLLTSGKWCVCQEALESILEGYPIKPFYQEEETDDGDSKLRSGNHRNPRSMALMDVIAKELHKVRNKGRFKIPCATAKHTSVVADGRTDISNNSVLEQLQQKKPKQQGVRERTVHCVTASSDLSCNTAVVAEDATLHLKNKSYDAEDEGVHLELTLGCAQFRSQVSPSMRTQKQEMNLDEQRRGPCMERERYSPSAYAFTSLGIGFAAT